MHSFRRLAKAQEGNLQKPLKQNALLEHQLARDSGCGSIAPQVALTIIQRIQQDYRLALQTLVLVTRMGK